MKIKTKLRPNTVISLGVLILIMLSFAWFLREIFIADRNTNLVDEMRKVAFDRTLLREEYLLYQEERAKTQWRAKSEALRDLLVLADTRFDKGEDKALLQDAREYFDAAFSGMSMVMEGRARQAHGANTKHSFSDAEAQLISQALLKAYSLTGTINKLHEAARKRATNARNRAAATAGLIIFGGLIVFILKLRKEIATRRVAEEKLRQSERMKTILNRVANVFLTVPDEEVYGEVLNVVLEVMESRFGIFGFIADNGDLVIPSMTREVWSECQVPEKSIVFPPHTWGGSLWGRAIREKKTFYSNNPFKVPEGHIPIANFLTSPIVFRDKTIGLLSVGNKEGGYTEGNKDLHESIANSISPILNIRLQRDLQERERECAEEAMRKSEGHLRALVQTIPDLIWLKNAEGIYLACNPMFERFFGAREADIIGKTDYDFVDRDLADFFREHDRKAMAAGKPSRNEEWITFADDGHRALLETIKTPMYDAEGKLIGILGIGRDITERKRTEEALCIKEQQLIEAQRVGQIGNWDWDPTTDTIIWSDEYYHIFSLDPKLPAPNYLEHLKIYTQESSERLDVVVKKALQNGEPYELDLELSDPGGRTRWICARGEVKRDASGRIAGLRGTAQNITERKHTEEMLSKNEARLRTLVQTIPDLIWLKDTEGIYLACNPMFERFFGAREADIIGKTDYDFIDRELADFFRELDRKAMAAGKPSSNEEWGTFADDGHRALLHTLKTPMFDAKGKLIGVLGIARDITERKKAEDALRGSEERFKVIFDSASDGILLADTGTMKFYMGNKKIYQMLGYTENEIKKLGVMDIHPEADLPHVIEQFKKQERREIEVAVDIPVKRKDGSIFYADINSFHITLADSKYLIGIFRDITERKQAEEEKKKLENQLRHAQKMEAVGTLAGGIAHDFNNILNVIIGYGTMLQDRLGDDHLSREQINEVLAAADRAATLTKRLLTFSRKQVVEVKPVNVNETILGLEKMLSRIIGEDIAFAMELTSRKMIVMADTGQIEQVLMNLISNACYVMPKGGRLTISTGTKEMDDAYIAAYGYGKAGTYALISVADTGSGMDAETQKKIFEPFFTTKGVGEGTGLGLSIVYGIIKQHNGYINVYSEPGAGTVFKIYLPLIEEETAKGQEVEAAAPGKGGTETILLAEDDAALRKLSRIVLESFGYTVITAEDGEEAISKYMENKDNISLVVLDMIMPKKNGKEAYAEIKKIWPDIKALFVSGYTMDVINKKELLDNGMDYILKPVSPRDLVKKVRETLDR